MGLLDFIFGKSKRRRARKRARPRKTCPKTSSAGKKVFRDQTGCFTKHRVKKVARKTKG